MSDWLFLLGALLLWALTVLAGAMWATRATTRDLARLLKGSDRWPTFNGIREMRSELYWARLDRERDRDTIALARTLIGNHDFETRIYLERLKRAEAELAQLAADASCLATLTVDSQPNTAARLRVARRVLERPSVKALADQGRIN